MLLLDDTDKKILAALLRKGAYASELSRFLKLPRTTISFRLVRLESFKKVTRETLGRKTLWRMPKEKIHNKSHYRIFEGEEFLECYKMINILPKDSVMYVVQGKAAAEAEFRHVPEELMKELHRTIKRRSLVMRAITNRDILAKISALDDELKKSHKGRAQSIKLVDKSFLSSGELFVTKEYISIINPNKKVGIVIKDQDVVELLHDFAKLFFELGDRLETTDVNAFIEKSL